MRPGQLVVATPSLTDPSFARTVVLLLQVGPEDGALGLVLNRPTGSDVVEVLPDWAPLAAQPSVVFTGGPVAGTSAICLGRGRLHRAPVAEYSELEGLPGGSVGTVDLDGVAAEVGTAVEHVRLFAGYAGWSPGQLEAEVAEGAWFVLDALPDDAFDPEPERLWEWVLRRQGPPVAFAASYPTDPTLN